MYGIITDTDARTLERSLDMTIATFGNNLRLLEVGICHGDTSRGVAKYLKDRNIDFKYYGIDSGKECTASPFPECEMIWGPSEEVFMQVPDNIHWMFLDGCHCNNHVILDFSNYHEKICLGGYLIFHDVNPKNQFKFDYQSHGPKEEHEFGTAVVTALRKLGLSNGRRSDWSLVEQMWDEQDWGGMAIYKRVQECG